METLIQQHSTIVSGPGEVAYTTRIMGAERTDGTWEGWIEFLPMTPGGHIYRTTRETSQSNRQALAYWASGLEPIYFEGAFERANVAIG